MRCFISLTFSLLALEVVLAQIPLTQDFNPVQLMCPEASSSEDADCITCRTNEECAQNTMCCPSSCGRICKTPVNIDIPKAGQCPWNPLQMIQATPCLQKNFCFRDNDCTGNMKCCSDGCSKKCMTPQAVSPTEESFQ